MSLSRSFATFVHVILFVMKTNRNTRGVLLALIGGTGWGFSGACSQYLFAQNVDPLWASAVAMAVAGAALMLYAATRRRESLRALFSNPRAVARLVLFSLVGLTLCRVTYLLAIQYSNAGTATVLQYVGPVLIVVASCFSKRRPPSAKETVAVACVVLGTYLLATHGNPSTMALSFEGVFWGAVRRRCRGNLLPASWVSHERIRERISCRMRPAFGRSGAIPRCWLLEPSSRS
ncbi:MAG: DMT family transporter [Eggerthellaceae bacterium]